MPLHATNLVKHLTLPPRVAMSPALRRCPPAQAYRELSLQWHPDRVGEELKEEATERFKDINNAYQVGRGDGRSFF